MEVTATCATQPTANNRVTHGVRDIYVESPTLCPARWRLAAGWQAACRKHRKADYQSAAKTKPKGPASQLILHQNGRDTTAKRLDDAEAKKVADAAAAFDKRFKDQTAAPGSEAALRRMIEELQNGKPNYDRMSAGLANATRQQLPQLQSTITGLGALQSVKFTGVGPGGADIYQVKFEKGSLEYRIWLAADGKIESTNFRPGQ